jgi:hypothetical protein
VSVEAASKAVTMYSRVDAPILGVIEILRFFVCSNCGGRLMGERSFDFERCKVPESYLSRFPRDLSYDLDAPASQRDEERRRYDIRQSCERFNEQLDEMARVIKYEGVGAADWHFNRLNIGRFVDALPSDVPGRETIVARLWTTVSDVERAAASRDIEEQTEEVQQALKNGDVKKAEKAITGLRELIAGCPSSGASTAIAEFEAVLAKIQSSKVWEMQSAAFQKLLDKADKLAFQQESKKAVKAYQECLFWLSRYELPEKDRVQGEVEQKLHALQTENPG